MRNRGWADRFLLAALLLLTLFGGLGLLRFPAPRYAETENRYLADLPVFGLPALLDGSYTDALDRYAAERFPARSAGRALRALGHLALGAREVDGVILCRDGSLLRRMTVNERALGANLAALDAVGEGLGGLPLTVAVAPRRIDARGEVLPALYDASREREVWHLLAEARPDALTFPDCTDDAFWFRTDHHWTAEGAFFAYQRLCAPLGIEDPLDRAALTRTTVCTDFLGTSAAAAGIPRVAPDRVDLLRYAGDDALCLVADGAPLPFPGLYDLRKLAARDRYAVFLGGNYGTLEITTGEGDARPTLLVVKDSFANAVLPFLARDFRVLAVDPRCFRGNLASLARSADRALILCGMQTLSESECLPALLRGT